MQKRLSGTALGWILLTLAVAAWAAASPASADTITFDGFGHGDVVNSVDGVTITAENPNRSFAIAVAFDSNFGGATTDTDLLAASGGITPWSGGNLEGEFLGRLLIIQENDDDCEDGTGTCSDPDDEGSRDPRAGMLTIAFATPVVSFGLDLVDIESNSAESGSIQFIGDGGSTTVNFTDFLNDSDLGDNTANRVTPFLAGELDLTSISQVVITLGGSGAIDNLEFQPVPEPGTFALVGLGLAALARSCRAAERA